MRICADCSGPIKKHDRWKIDGSRIRHVSCSNPRLTIGRLPLLAAAKPTENKPV